MCAYMSEQLTSHEPQLSAGAIHLLMGQEILNHPQTVAKVANTYLVVFGEAAEEGAFCSEEGRKKHISLSDYRSLFAERGFPFPAASSPRLPSTQLLAFHDSIESATPEFLQAAAHCETSQCAGHYVPYYTQAEVLNMFASQLTPTPDKTPLLSYWEDEELGAMMRAFSMGFVCNSTDAIHQILSTSPYFAYTHDEPHSEIDCFLSKIPQLTFPYFYGHEAATLPEYRGQAWSKTSVAIGQELIKAGAQQMIVCTFEASPFYQFLKKIRQDTVVYQTSANDLLVLADNVPVILRILEKTGR